MENEKNRKLISIFHKKSKYSFNSLWYSSRHQRMEVVMWQQAVTSPADGREMSSGKGRKWRCVWEWTHRQSCSCRAGSGCRSALCRSCPGSAHSLGRRCCRHSFCSDRRDRWPGTALRRSNTLSSSRYSCRLRETHSQLLTSSSPSGNKVVEVEV